MFFFTPKRWEDVFLLSIVSNKVRYMELNRFWRLLSRKLANEATCVELKEFEQLIEGNPEYRLFFKEVIGESEAEGKEDIAEAEQAFALHSVKLQLSSSQQLESYSADIPPKLEKQKAPRYHSPAYVLGFLLFLVVGYVVYHHHSDRKVTLNTIEVPLGQRVKVILPDSSIVWLNAKSRFTFPSSFNGTKREVRLDGEGFFDVSHNSSKPFIVITSNHRINVLGTVFNVNAYSNSKLFETTLLSGTVKVEQKDGSSLVAVLKPDEKFTYNKSKVASSVVKVNSKDYSTWKDGLYQFNHIPFSEMINELQHYKDIKIVVKDSSILDIVCTGKFRQQESIQEILDVIKTDIPFKYVYDKRQNQLTLLSSK